MSASTLCVSAVICLVKAPPALRIEVVGPEQRPVLLLRSSSRLGPLLCRPAPPRSPSRPGSRILGPRPITLRVVGTRTRTHRGRATAARCAASENTLAGLLRDWMDAARWMCWIRVGLGSMRIARLASINRADRLAILPYVACRVQAVGRRTSPLPPFPTSSVPLPPFLPPLPSPFLPRSFPSRKKGT